jgi:hypothetical protein
MLTEQQLHESALMGGLEGREILPRGQDRTVLASSSDLKAGPDSARRLRACVACKESKVRCKRDENRPGDACERCVSAGRQCIVSERAKNKRPKRNTGTVASLESKVDALVAAMKVTQAGGVEDRVQGSPIDPTLGWPNSLLKW